MTELLNKYYEYFTKGDFHDQENIDDDSEFYGFYKIIINEYDLSKDEQMKIDMREFFDFFDKTDIFGMIRRGFYSTTGYGGEENSKRRFERHKTASFDWFNPSPYMISNSNFVYSIKRAKKPFCKAYLSIKPEKYLSIIIKLQDFINKLYINHPDEEIGQCKFRNIPSNDAIAMRFACEEHYNEFLQYLEQNKDIMESFDAPNLFMPQDNHGLSLIVDNGGSYNYFVTRIIWDYMFYCRNINSNVSVEGIVEFINNYDCSKDKMINENDEETILNYKTILCGKILSKSNDELLSLIVKSKAKTLKLTKV
ncbi:MAG: hypothetical protein ACI310_00460 [Bacilli bacterium]